MDSDYDKVAELLHDEAVNISATDKGGRTPLHYACSVGNERIVGRLIQESVNCIGPALHGNDTHSQIKHFINLTDNSEVRNIVSINNSNNNNDNKLIQLLCLSSMKLVINTISKLLIFVYLKISGFKE